MSHFRGAVADIAFCRRAPNDTIEETADFSGKQLLPTCIYSFAFGLSPPKPFAPRGLVYTFNSQLPPRADITLKRVTLKERRISLGRKF